MDPHQRKNEFERDRADKSHYEQAPPPPNGVRKSTFHGRFTTILGNNILD